MRLVLRPGVGLVLGLGGGGGAELVLRLGAGLVLGLGGRAGTRTRDRDDTRARVRLVLYRMTHIHKTVLFDGLANIIILQ